MNLPWSSRLTDVVSRALPGLLHEFSSPASIVRNDAQFLLQETSRGTVPELVELRDIAQEMDDATSRLILLLDSLKRVPASVEIGRPFPPVCNSVLTLLHNHWKYAWTIENRLVNPGELPCPELLAWIAWAEGLQVVTESFTEGGTLVLTDAVPGPGVNLELLPMTLVGAPLQDAFIKRWDQLLQHGPLIGHWNWGTEPKASTTLWFSGGK